MYVKVAFALTAQGSGAGAGSSAAVPQQRAASRARRLQQSHHFRNVTIARDDGNFVELGSGVASGDRLVLNLSSQINTGDLVRVSATPQAGAPAKLAASGH